MFSGDDGTKLEMNNNKICKKQPNTLKLNTLLNNP